MSTYFGKRLFEVDALLLVLPTREYHKRVSVAIDISITDLAINSLNT